MLVLYEINFVLLPTELKDTIMFLEIQLNSKIILTIFMRNSLNKSLTLVMCTRFEHPFLVL